MPVPISVCSASRRAASFGSLSAAAAAIMACITYATKAGPEPLSAVTASKCRSGSSSTAPAPPKSCATVFLSAGLAFLAAQ